MEALIAQELTTAAEVLKAFNTPEQLTRIAQAAELMLASLKAGGKIMTCGNGGSMADAMHMAEELTGRYRENRPPVAALSLADPTHLSCVANDYGYDQVFARGVQALGRPGDVLVAISTSGNSANVLRAAETARQLGVHVVGLTGKDGGLLASLCSVEIRVPYHGYADRIQEIHIKVIHCWIMLLERGLYPA